MSNEYVNFRGIKEIIDLGSRRKKIIIRDADTREIVLEGYSGNINFAFSDGVNCAPFNGIVSREILPDGSEYREVTNTGNDREIILRGTYKNSKYKLLPEKSEEPPPKHTGGKYAFVKVYITKLLACKGLEDRHIGAAIMLAKYVSWDTGLLVDKRKNPIDFDGIKKILRCSNQTASDRISALKKAGVLLHDKEGYKLSANFIAKGK
jgi:hypothetical protein